MSSRASLEEIAYLPPASAAGRPAIHPLCFLRCLYWLLTVAKLPAPHLSGLTGEEGPFTFSASLLSHSASLTGSCPSDQPTPLGLSTRTSLSLGRLAPSISSSSFIFPGSLPPRHIHTEVLTLYPRHPPLSSPALFPPLADMLCLLLVYWLSPPLPPTRMPAPSVHF